MPSTRPIECPACGHEGISRASVRLDDRGRRSQSSESWTCRLCAYTWSRPTPAGRATGSGLDSAHP